MRLGMSEEDIEKLRSMMGSPDDSCLASHIIDQWTHFDLGVGYRLKHGTVYEIITYGCNGRELESISTYSYPFKGVWSVNSLEFHGEHEYCGHLFDPYTILSIQEI